MQSLTTSQRFGIVVKDVQLKPLSVALWVTSAALSVYLRTPFILLGCFGLQTVRTAMSLHDESYLKALFEKRDETAKLSDDQIETILEGLDFETRQRLRYILQLQKEIIREVRGEDVEQFLADSLEKIVKKLYPLTEQAIHIAERKQKLSRYLYNVDERALQQYCNVASKKIKETDDPVQKSQYEQALKARQNELDTYQSISRAAARIDSQLENVEATFASWKATVIRIKTSDVSNAASASEGLYNELNSLSSEINILDSSVSEALSPEIAVVSVH